MTTYTKYFNKPTRTSSTIGYDHELDEKQSLALMHSKRATANWSQGNKDLAIPLISESIKFWPDNPNYYLVRGEYLYAMNKYDEALNDLETYLSYDYENELIYEKYGVCNLNKRDYSTAKLAFEAAIEIIMRKGKEEFEIITNYKYVDVLSRFYNNLANSRLSIGTNEELNLAGGDCLSALKLNPKYSSPYFTMGLISLRIHEKINVSYDNHFLLDAIDYLIKASELGNEKAFQYVHAIKQKYGL